MQNEGCEWIRQLAFSEAADHNQAEQKGWDGSDHDNEIHVVEDEARREFAVLEMLD